MRTTYFDRKGKRNTEQTLKLAYQEAIKSGITTIVVASTKGNSALEAIRTFQDKAFKLIIVTHHSGFREEVDNEFSPDLMKKIKEKRPNTVFLTGTHAFAGLERSFRVSHDTILPVEMIAIVLRRCFGDGTKVAMELAIMASDAGLANPNLDIICIGGTGQGLDTAWIIKPSYSNRLFDLKMKIPICKPENF
ncbi:MAG: pyruvate kinase alpha/beta domain-containing protein [Candidatus Hodarchaeales archaeon]|jgi:hypothetical protein